VTELAHQDPFQLVIATILSAQTTDRSVNLVTPELFKRYPTAADLAAADPADVEQLIKTFRDLIDRGNSVVVIEHNVQLIESADWVIDLGPEGGDGGGEIVAAGTPAQIAECERSITGRYLQRGTVLASPSA